MSAELTGRVESLETKVAQILQDLLVRPDLSQISNFQQSVNQQLGSVTSTVNNIVTTSRTVQNLYTSLALDVSNLRASFTGHTGVPAASGHAGLTGS